MCLIIWPVYDILDSIGRDGQKITAYYQANGQLLARQEYSVRKSKGQDRYRKRPRGRIEYYAHDGLGSVVVLTNHRGKINTQLRYDVYGSPVVGKLDDNPYGFTGKRFDVESGLYHFHFRKYDPVTGVWTSEDPIRVAGGINLYGYVQNDPLNFRDNLGLDPLWSARGFGNENVSLGNISVDTEVDLKKGTAKGALKGNVGEFKWQGESDSGILSGEAGLSHWNAELSAGATEVYQLGSLEGTAKIAAFEAGASGTIKLGPISVEFSASGTLGSLGVEAKAGLKGLKAGAHLLVGGSIGISWEWNDEEEDLPY